MDPFPMTTADLASYTADIAKRQGDALYERVKQLEKQVAELKRHLDLITTTLQVAVPHTPI